VVVGAEGYHLPRVSIHPVWPGAMKAVGGLQKRKDFRHSLQSFSPCYESAFHPNDERHNAKAGASARHKVTRAVAFASHPTGRMREIPEVPERLRLHKRKEFILRDDWELKRLVGTRIEQF